MMTMMGRDGNTVSVGGGGEALSGTGLNLYKIQRIHQWPLFFPFHASFQSLDSSLHLNTILSTD